MKNIKKILEILMYNYKTLINFELIYKAISTIIFIPLFLGLFNLTMKITGYSYLTFENIFSFILNPITILMLLLLIIIMTFYSLIDISSIIIILDSSYQKEKIKVKEAFITSIKKVKKVFNHKNILIAFLVLFMIPFLNLGVSSNFISTIKIPEFIMDYIINNKLLFSLYIILVILLCFLLFRWIYSLHYFILEDKNFKEARRKSISLSKKNKFKDFLVIIVTQICISLLYLIFVLIGIFLIIIFNKLFGNNLLGNLSITIIWIFIAISFVIFTLLGTPTSYASISILYYNHKEQIKEKIEHIKINHNEIKKQSKLFNVFKVLIIIITILCGMTFTYYLYTGKYKFNIEYVRTMEVTAHRGASVLYPENTMAAFKGAKDLGADWIELDVQQTKDKKLVILHDTNLKRTTGVDKNTWEATYDEIKELDAGSFFSKDFKGEKIPLLEEIVEYAKDNNIKLNIELKPTGKETDFEKSVVDVINKYDFADMCVITSQVYEVLENVKKYDKNVETVYVMSLAYGNITNLKAADNFSIEASSVNNKLVKKVHNAGKELYVWTVNNKENMQKMIKLNVDNIITDNITLAKDTIVKSKTSNIVEEYINLIENLFK